MDRETDERLAIVPTTLYSVSQKIPLKSSDIFHFFRKRLRIFN